jgi:hypothetical protein
VADLPNLLAAASATFYGTVAYAECPKLGYRVEPQAWHALVEKLAPGHTALDFGPNGQFAKIGGKTYLLLIKDFEIRGAKVWCARVARMARRRYPESATSLISLHRKRQRAE